MRMNRRLTGPATRFWLAAVASLVAFASVPAGTGVWTPLGPFGGYVNDLAAEPDNAAIMYVCTSSNGVYKTTDGGAHWSLSASSANINYPRSLVIDPSNHNIIYCGTDGDGVYKSTNAGLEWSKLNTSALPTSQIYTLAINPQNPAILYAGTLNNGVFRTTDGGGSWAARNAGFTTQTIYDLAVDPLTPATVYAGTYNGGLLKSTDGGGTWSTFNVGFTATRVYCLQIDPQAPATLYAGMSDGAFKTTNGGSNWSSILPERARALALDPVNPAYLYAGTPGQGIKRSTNRGAQWTPASTGLPFTEPRMLAVVPAAPASVLAGMGGVGIFKTIDRGDHWNPSSTGLTATEVRDLAVDAAHTGTFYAAIESLGIYKTTDWGGTWQEVNTNLTNWDVRALVIHPSNPAILYAGTGGDPGLFKTANGGGQWEPANSGLTDKSILSLAIDPANPLILYAGAATEFYKSTNGGQSWSLANTGLPNNNYWTIAIDPINSGNIYTGTLSGSAFASTDAGAHWAPANNGLASRINDLLADPHLSGTVYAATSGGVYKTTNAGNSWNRSNFQNNAEQLAIDPRTPQVLFIGTWGEGVFKSTDAGSSWTDFNNGLAGKNIRVLQIDPQNYAIVYAGTAGAGAFSYTVSEPCTAPAFITHPQNQTIAAGQTASLGVTLTGTAPIAYQWYKGISGNTANPVTGATANSLTTAVLSATTSYWVRAANACGSRDSNAATITVYNRTGNFTVGGFLGAGLQAPERALHLRGSNAVFRMDRTAGASAFLMVRTDGAGAIQKGFLAGTEASGVNTGQFVFRDTGTSVADGAGNNRLVIGNDGTATFSGDVKAKSFVTASSARWKENVVPLENAAELVSRLYGVRYCWKEEAGRSPGGGREDVGLIAEEVARVVPEAVDAFRPVNLPGPSPAGDLKTPAETGENAVAAPAAIDGKAAGTGTATAEESHVNSLSGGGVVYGKLFAVALEVLKNQQAQLDGLARQRESIRQRLEGLAAGKRAPARMQPPAGRNVAAGRAG